MYINVSHLRWVSEGQMYFRVTMRFVCTIPTQMTYEYKKDDWEFELLKYENKRIRKEEQKQSRMQFNQ